MKDHEEELLEYMTKEKSSDQSAALTLGDEIKRLKEEKSQIILEKNRQELETRDTVAKLKAIIDEKTNLATQFEAKVTALTSEIGQEKDKSSKVVQEFSEVSTKLSGLEVNMKELNDENSKLAHKTKDLQELISELETKAKKLGIDHEGEIEKWKIEVKDLKAKVVDLEGQLEEKKLEVKHYMDSCEEKKQLDTQLLELKSQRDGLAIELQNNQNFADVLKAEVKKLKSAIEENEKTISQKDRDFEEYRQKSVMEKAEINSSVKAEFDQVVNKIKNKDVEIDRLKNVVSKLESDGNGLQEQKGKLTEELKRTKQSLASKEEELEKNIQSSKENLAEKTRELNKLSNSSAALQKQIEIGLARESDLLKEVQTKEDELKDQATQISSLNNQISSFEKRIEELEETIANLEQDCKQKIEKAIQERNEVEEMYTEELARVEEEKEKYKTEAEMSRKDILNKAMEIVHLKQVHEDIQIESQQKSAQIDRLNKELQSKIVDTGGVLKAKDKYISQMEAKIRSQEEDIEKMAGEILSKEKRIQSFETEIEVLNTNIETLTENLDNMATQNEEIIKDLNEANEENNNLNKELSHIQELLNQQTILADRNLQLSNNKSASIENLKKEIEKNIADQRVIEESLRKEKDITRTQAQLLSNKDLKISELNSQLSKQAAEVEQDKRKISEIEKIVHDLETALSLSTTKISSQSAKIASLEKHIKDDRDNKHKQEGVVKEKEQGVEFMRQSLERERSDREKDRKSMEIEVEKLRESWMKETRKREWVETEKEKVDLEVRRLESELKESENAKIILEDDIKTKDEDLARMKGDIANLASKATELEDALDEAVDQRDQQKEAFTQSLFEISNLEKELQEARNKLEEVQTLFERLDSLQNRCELLEAECQEKESESEGLNAKIIELDLANERLSAQTARFKEEKNLAEERCEDLLLKVQKAEDGINNVITERNMEREEKKSLKQQLATVEKQLASHSEREEDLQRRLREAREELKIRQSEVDILEKKLGEANETNARFTATITGFQLKFTQIQKEKDAKTKELEETKRELALIRQQESEKLDKIKSEINTADLEKSELGGRLKEMAANLENYRSRLENEKEASLKLKIDLENQVARNSASEKTIDSLKLELDQAIKNPKIVYREEDAALLWKMIALKCQVAKLRQRYVATLIVVTKNRSFAKRARQLEKENTKLSEDFMVLTKKLIFAERNRSEMEDQLNQLDQVMMVSKTLRSETDANLSAREPSTEGRKVTETRAHQLKQILRDLLKINQELLGLDVPPLDNLNDRMWDTYTPRFKSKLTEILIKLDEVEEMKAHYMTTIDVQSQEIEKLREDLKQKQLGNRRLI